MIDLSTTIAGIKLKNPIILASGILGETASSMQRVLATGAGAVTTKSIGLEPRQGHDNPTIVELETGILNAMGLPNPGIDAYLEELEPLINQEQTIIGSIFGKDHSEFVELATRMANAGIPALELNLSCPHAKGYGAELGSDPKSVREITGAVKDTVKIPVLVKLTPNTANIVELADAAVSAGADGLVAINTVKGLAISSELGRPILSNKYGGYSGPGIKPIGLRCVYELASNNPDIPIIGVGGITNGMDIVEYMMAGASAVQVGTIVYYRGIAGFENLKIELEKFMENYGFPSVTDLVGTALGK
jgi:dihydroorotate dehydrogenase (NAD+) catalytic subunit